MSNYFGAIDPFEKDNVLSKQNSKRSLPYDQCFQKKAFQHNIIRDNPKKKLASICDMVVENCVRIAENKPKKNYLKTEIYVKM